MQALQTVVCVTFAKVTIVKASHITKFQFKWERETSTLDGRRCKYPNTRGYEHMDGGGLLRSILQTSCHEEHEITFYVYMKGLKEEIPF